MFEHGVPQYKLSLADSLRSQSKSPDWASAGCQVTPAQLPDITKHRGSGRPPDSGSISSASPHPSSMQPIPTSLNITHVI